LSFVTQAKTTRAEVLWQSLLTDAFAAVSEDDEAHVGASRHPSTSYFALLAVIPQTILAEMLDGT